MSKHSQYSRVVAGGLPLSGVLRDVSLSRALDTADASTFESSAHEYVSGMIDGTLSASGVFKDTIDTDSLQGDQDLYVTVGLGSTSEGDDVFMLRGHNTALTRTATIGDVVQVSLDLQLSGPNPFLHGHLLLDHDASDTTAHEAGSVDNTAASADGLLIYCHIRSVTGATAAVLDVQESANGSTWSTIESFSALATVGAVRAVRRVHAGSIARYLRGRLTAGSGGTLEATISAHRL